MMMPSENRIPSTVRKKRQRERLFCEQQGRCYWCGRPMVMPIHEPGKAHPPNAATIEHLFSKLHPDRGKVRGQTHVLACWECNFKRGLLEEREQQLRKEQANGTENH